MSQLAERGAQRLAAITIYGCIQSSVREMRRCIKAGRRREAVEELRLTMQDVYRPLIKKAQLKREAWEWAMKVND